MTALVRAELLKLRTVQLTAWLLAATVLVVVLEVLAMVLGNNDGTGPGQRQDPDLLAHSLASASAGEVVVLVLGVLALCHEFRYGTAASTFLATPRRGQVVGAKLVAAALVGLAFAVVSMLLAVPLCLWLIGVRHGHVTWDGKVVEVLVGVVLVMAVYGPLGVALGSLVRNQIVAIAGSLTWLFVVDGVLAVLLPRVEEWTPGGATGAVLQTGTWAGTEHVLAPWLGGLVLVGWVALFACLGVRVAMRRDIT